VNHQSPLDLPCKREPPQTIGVGLGRNESGARSNGTDIPPPTLTVIPCESDAKAANDTAVNPSDRIPTMLNRLSESWPGLVPAIHACLAQSPKEDVDARDKRGHDDGEPARLA
jgi:hypothetical protein